MTKAIVCDIENTTTSLSFVKDTLFPYARRRMSEYVRKYANDPVIAPLLDDTRQAIHRPDVTLQAIIAQLERWIDEDKKVTPLKAIQGYIWEGRYQSGDYFTE